MAEVMMQYPRMLYLNGDQRIVQNESEEEAAVRDGFASVPPSRFEEGFPKWMAERPTSMGGWKQADLRRVQLRSSLEERQFRAVTEEADWMGDNANIWGARGVSLTELVAERKEVLMAIIDTEELNERP